MKNLAKEMEAVKDSECMFGKILLEHEAAT